MEAFQSAISQWDFFLSPDAVQVKTISLQSFAFKGLASSPCFHNFTDYTSVPCFVIKLKFQRQIGFFILQVRKFILFQICAVFLVEATHDSERLVGLFPCRCICPVH